MKTQTTLMIALALAATGCLAKSEAPSGAYKGAAVTAEAAAPAPSAAVADRAAVEGAGADGVSDEPARIRPMAGQLTAGEWSDIDNWDFWSSLMDDGFSQHLDTWRFDLQRRFTVNVTDGDGALRNVPVTLLDKQGDAIWTAKTDGDGHAVVFAGTQDVGPFEVRVANEAPTKIAFGEPLSVRINQGPEVADAVDVMFVVDTTGSMGDELSYIQSELTDVARRVKKRTNNEFELRVAASVYRDTNDEYVVRSSKLSANIARAQGFLNDESAGGGGDFPEAVDEALDEAIHEHQWSPNARARIAFLVLDAPPHQDDEGIARLHEAVQTAAKQGIQLIPVVGSGIDKPTEFLMRSIAIATNGTYVFLTDDSGIGGTHLEPTTGDFEVERLNDLLVRLIVERAS